MHDVVVYVSSLPKISGRNRKVEVLQAFAEGTKKLGLKTLVQTQREVVPCRLAVILGWVGTSIRGPHIQLRQQVIDQQRVSNGHVMAIDGSCFKFADIDNQWLRYSLGGVYYNTNNYANQGSDAQRWQTISGDLDLRLQPWRSQGEHVLVCLQRDGGWSMKGMDMDQWVNHTVHVLRQHTTRPILIRPHPKASIDLRQVISANRNVYVSAATSTLQDDIQGAWASVFFNSSSCVASMLAGIPVFAQDSDCVAWSVANQDLAQIEQPLMPDRDQWLWNLSAAHWTDQHSRQGQIYQKFAGYF